MVGTLLIYIDLGLDPETEGEANHETKICEVNGVLSLEGYANLSFGRRCWSKSDWRKPSFPSGYALVSTWDFSPVVPAERGSGRLEK